MNWKYDVTMKSVFRFIGQQQDKRSIEDPEIQQWLAEGNEPDPPDPLPPPPDPSTTPPSVEERLQAAETLINLILDKALPRGDQQAADQLIERYRIELT